MSECDKTSLVLLVDFWFPSLVGRAKDKIDEKKLSSWKLLDRLAHLADKLKLVDGTLLPALPRMEILEELPHTAADRAAGVTWQGMVKTTCR